MRKTFYRIGEAYVDFDRLDIHGPNGKTSMESKVMDVLKVLTDHSGQVVTRDELIDQVWGIGFGADERLTRAISLLRKAFGEKSKDNQIIQTIPRKGYLLDADIDRNAQFPERQNDLPANNHRTRIQTSQTEKLIQPPPRYISRVIISGISALLVVLISTYLNLNNERNATEQRNPTIASGLEKIHHFNQKNSIPEAQNIFESLLAEDPDHTAARAGLALALINAYIHLDKDDTILNRANSLAQSAYRKNSNLALSNIAVAWLHDVKGQLEKAHEFYDRAEILDPDNRLILEGRARTYYKQGRWNEMRSTLEHGVKTHPDHGVFFDYLGQLDAQQNDYVSAERNFRKLVKLSNGRSARVYAQLAQSLHLQNRSSEAIQVIQDGLELNDDSLLYNNLGTYLYFDGQYEMSATAFENTIKTSGETNNYLYWANLADAYRQVPGKKAEAHQSYDTAIRILRSRIQNDRATFGYNSRLALYLAKRGLLDDAWQEIHTLPQSSKLSAADYYRLTLLHEILSDRDKALTYVNAALDAGYPLREITNEPELQHLRKDRNYQLLLTRREQ